MRLGRATRSQKNRYELTITDEHTMTTGAMKIGKRKVGPGQPVYVIAELSANHNQDFDQAVRIIEVAKQSGADAVKLQTYTPDTITIASDRDDFRIGGGTLWDGRTLYDLYSEALHSVGMAAETEAGCR